MNIFEKATRTKLRFETERGALTVEDLWQLPLDSATGVSLDALAIHYNEQLTEQPRTSFVNATKSNAKFETIQLKFDIVKHIIDVRLAEQNERIASAKKEQEIALLKNALAERKVQDLQNMTTEELQKRIAELSQ